jgi:hypothetical protein
MTEFIFPTCADLITILLRTPDAPFRISDPDTGWTISKFKVSLIDGTIYVSAEYADMDATEPDGVER